MAKSSYYCEKSHRNSQSLNAKPDARKNYKYVHNLNWDSEWKIYKNK